MDFKTPTGQTLATGMYEGARGIGKSSGPGIGIASYTPYGSCPAQDPVVGRFVIYQISFASSTSSSINALALDFEYRCTPTSPPLIGSVRFNASRPELRPFASPAVSAGPYNLTGDRAADIVWQNRDDGRLSGWHT
ncbi:MAG: hypothetical protein H0W08_21545 [Acidobacteria bacterium]|nr:hypothetical protein [Acidobacteriota bacterium]